MHTIVRRAAMAWYRHRYWRDLERAATCPEAAQAHVLRTILTANRETTYGREHGFSGADTVSRFRERTPVVEYESLRPYIDRQRRTGEAALTVEAPISYAQTSGTTGAPKYVPMTRTALATYRAEQALFSYLQYRARPAAFVGMALGIMGAAVEDRLDSGHVVGSVSGQLYASLPRFVLSRAVLPPEVSSIADYELKYQTILLLALACADLTYAGAPNPSTFVRLLRVLNEHRETLLRSLATGESELIDRLGEPISSVVRRRLRRDPDRAARLNALPELTYANTWPQLALVTTWTGGSCGVALAALRQTLPQATAVMELGYQATEMRGTLALAPETPGGVPPLHHYFFEFVERDAWDERRPSYLGLEELRPGTLYYVVVTTAAGLYRYFMNDLVEVTGVFHHTPLLRFVQKGRGVTSLTGEKLYEGQVLDAVQGALDAQGIAPSFLVLVARPDPAAYCLFVEGAPPASDVHALATDVDRRLADLNLEYRSKRVSGRLSPLTVRTLMPGTADAYRAAAVSRGQREGQLKPPVLQYEHDLLVPLDSHVLS